jgi:hypothetical protein
MIVKTDLETLLRKLQVALPLKGDGGIERVRELQPIARDGDLPARVEPAFDQSLEPLLVEVREWAAAMAWSRQPSRAVLNYVLLAADGRLTELFGEGVATEKRQATLDICRNEAWLIIMDIRRAA